MKKVKKVNGFTIFELNNKDKECLNTDSKYVCFTSDEMEQPKGYRYYEMEENNLDSMIEFCESY